MISRASIPECHRPSRHALAHPIRCVGESRLPHVYELILLIACIGCVATATSILVRDPDEPMNRYASIIVYGGGFWALCEIL